jgi:E3 ubiquitin-protein ligase UBR7
MGLPRDWYTRQEWKEEGANWEKKFEDGESERKEEVSHPVPPGFPHEDDFEAMICYKCVESNPWIKKYAGTAGFLPPVANHEKSLAAWAEEWKAMGCVNYAQYRDTVSAGCKTWAEYLAKTQPATAEPAVADSSTTSSLKRKASDGDMEIRPSSPTKRVKDEVTTASQDASLPSGLAQPSPTNGASLVNGAEIPSSTAQPTEPDSKPQHKHDLLPSPAPTGRFSLFLKADFRDHLCHCSSCYPDLIPHPQLVEDEETYEPSISSDGSSQHHPNGTNGGSSRASLLERGEAALSNIDRVRAIEGVMVYNHLRDKVKEFLKPYAEEGRVVSADDIKAYFEKLRGDSQGIKEARADAGGGEEGEGDSRREQSGY